MSDEPAPLVTIAGEAGNHHGAAWEGADKEEAAAGTSSATSPLTMAALVAGLLGLGLGAAAFARTGRTR